MIKKGEFRNKLNIHNKELHCRLFWIPKSLAEFIIALMHVYIRDSWFFAAQFYERTTLSVGTVYTFPSSRCFILTHSRGGNSIFLTTFGACSTERNIVHNFGVLQKVFPQYHPLALSASATSLLINSHWLNGQARFWAFISPTEFILCQCLNNIVVKHCCWRGEVYCPVWKGMIRTLAWADTAVVRAAWTSQTSFSFVSL